MPSREEIRVGVTWSDSGWCWLDSRFVHTGLRVWVAETNAAGGLWDPEQQRRVPVRLVRYDDRSDPPTAREAVLRMLDVDRVDVVVSSASSEIAAEVVPLTEERGVVTLNVGAPDSALFEGCRYHLQCGPPLRGYYDSRPPFWAQHGLVRVAVLGADLHGWKATAEPILDLVADTPGVEVVHAEFVPAAGRYSTVYGPYPADFEDWGGVVDGLVAARPDALVIALPAPAEYRIAAELRRRGLWFRYLEMMYSGLLTKAGLGPEDLLLQFHGGLTSRVDPSTINVGPTQAELDAKAQTYLPGVEPHLLGRSYVGVALWEHLVRGAGSFDADAVMAQAHRESGDLVTLEGRLTFLPNGDCEVGEGAWAGVHQIQRDPRTAELTSVPVWPEPAEAPVFSTEPYARRPPPWAGDGG